jgi:hypothetical protein
VGAVIEEVAKSAGLVTLLERGLVATPRQAVAASLAAAVGFLAAEKLLLWVSLSMVAESRLALSAGVGGSGLLGLLLVPLVAHTAFTLVGVLLMQRWGTRRYVPAVLVSAALHIAYNLVISGVLA